MAARMYGTGRIAVIPPPLTPPHKGEGVVGVGASESSSPLWGGVRGGGIPQKGHARPSNNRRNTLA